LLRDELPARAAGAAPGAASGRRRRDAGPCGADRLREDVVRFLLICLGGAVGTAARYLLSGWAQRELGTPVPFGTLAVNFIGSFAMAMIMYVGVARSLMRPDLAMILTTGVMGGFTTYSSFNWDIMRLVQGGAVGLGLLYAASTLVGCMLAGVAGLMLARM